MQKSKLTVLLASTILIAGILVAGCTDNGSSVETTNTLSTIPTRSYTADTAVPGAGQVQINESAGHAGTAPDGLQMNGTRPSGTLPDGTQLNGTRPSGNPPDGMQMNGTRPSGTPPDGMQGGAGPSGTPPSGGSPPS